MADQFLVYPPAKRNRGCHEENEDHGVTGAEAPFVDDLPPTQIGIKAALATAVFKVVGCRNGGALPFLLLAELVGSRFDQGFVFCNFGIESGKLVNGWFARRAFHFSEEHDVLAWARIT